MSFSIGCMDDSSNYIPPPAGINTDQAIFTLMAMAETLRGPTIYDYKGAIKCVLATLRVPSSLQLRSLCTYELGKLLWLYSRNSELALHHLTNSLNYMLQLGSPMEQTRIKTTCFICEILMHERRYNDAISFIQPILLESQKYPLINARLLLLYSEICMRVGDYNSSLEVARSAIYFFRQMKESIIECYFVLVKSLILSIQMTDQQELGRSVNELGEILQTVANDDPAINDIRTFCYTIQLCYFLSIGMVKSSKQCLRQLHMTVQTSEQEGSNSKVTTSRFRWLCPETLTGLAYVLTVVCNVQYGNFERAHRYFGTALKHFEGLRTFMQNNDSVTLKPQLEEFIDRLEIILYESVAQTQLIQANPVSSITQIENIVRKMNSSSSLFIDFEPQLHSLLALYSSYMRLPFDSERHFKAALAKANDFGLKTIIHLNLALIYLFTSRQSEFYEIFEHISPQRMPPHASSLKAAAFFVHSLHFYLHMRFNECRTHLMESITTSRDEDISRLQSMAFLLLSKLLYSRDQEVLNAAYELANKSNDVGLVMWTNIQITDLHMSRGQIGEAGRISTVVETQKQSIEMNRTSCARLQSHQLIQWTGEDLPKI